MKKIIVVIALILINIATVSADSFQDTQNLDMLGEIAYPDVFGKTSFIETPYKKVTLTVAAGGSIGAKVIDIDVEWKVIPEVKQYDLIGFYAESEDGVIFYPSVSSASQVYDGITYSYSRTSGNKIKRQNGLAYVMNIVDDVKESLHLHMNAQIISNGSVTIYATYNHAIDAGIKEREARKVKFAHEPSLGKRVLGGAFLLPTRIANKYDNMGALKVEYNPFTRNN